MRFWKKSQGVVDFYFVEDDDSETCERCLSEKIEGRCFKKRYAHSKEIKGDEFIFCYEKNKTAKQAKFTSKIAASAFKTAKKSAQRHQKGINELQTIAYHNAKKINASIGQKIDKILPDITALPHDQKIDRIVNAIDKDKITTATELLSIRKAVEQIEFEYNLIEAINLDEPFGIKDLTLARVHKLLVSAFYLYQEEFQRKKVFVNILDTDVLVRVDYGMAKSAVSQILDNAVKYCKPDSKIEVATVVKENYIEIQFFMTSLNFDNNDVDELTKLGARGANVTGEHGEGVGLFAINKFMQMHKGYFKMHASEVLIKSEGIDYSENVFTLGFFKN